MELSERRLWPGLWAFFLSIGSEVPDVCGLRPVLPETCGVHIECLCRNVPHGDPMVLRDTASKRFIGRSTADRMKPKRPVSRLNGTSRAGGTLFQRWNNLPGCFRVSNQTARHQVLSKIASLEGDGDDLRVVIETPQREPEHARCRPAAGTTTGRSRDGGVWQEAQEGGVSAQH